MGSYNIGETSESDLLVKDSNGDKIFNFTSVLEAVHDEIYIFETESLLFIWLDEGARRNLGYSIKELGLMTYVDINPEQSKFFFRKLIDPLVNGDKHNIEFNSVHRRRDGSIYPVEVGVQKIQHKNRLVFVALVLDVTQQFRVESDLIKAWSLFESAPDATVVVDESGMIQVANRQMVELFGYELSELEGMNIDCLLPKRFRSIHARQRTRFNANQYARKMGEDMNLLGLTMDNQEIPIEVSLSPVEWEGTKLVAAAIRDISSRIEIESALRRNEVKLQLAKNLAESATATKTRFLAAASHDLRQLLQALRLYLSALKSKLDNPKPLELSDKMNLSIDAMAGLLDALLDNSMLESGSIYPEKRDVVLSEILGRVVTDNQQQAERKGLKLDCDTIECVVHTDPALLERIVENFVSNAIRYTEKGGIVIRFELIGCMVRINIIDTGVGIAETELGSIFEEFYQINRGLADHNEGLGLGLSIVKHISHIVDHPVNVHSVVGEGSKFSVEVPLANNQKIAVHDSVINVPLPDLAAKPVILMVDDNPAIVDAMLEVMQALDLSITAAKNGNQALVYIQNGLKPDLVISDLRMPDMDGFELILKIRNLVSEDLPAVIMTGDTVALKMGGSQITNCTLLRKPINMDQLLSLMEIIGI